MALFARTSSTICDKLAQVDRDLGEQRKALAEAAIASAIDDSPEADRAQAEIYRLTQKREVLARALEAALEQERAGDLEKAKAVLQARARGADQHAAAVRASAKQIQADIAALADHWRELRAALGRLDASLGHEGAKVYPGLDWADMTRVIAGEIFRQTAEPTSAGDRSTFPGPVAPGIGAIPGRMTPLAEYTAALTHEWTGIYRSRLGIGHAHVHSEEPAP